MFRIKGYTGSVDVPELPDMDIDNDIADITYAQHFQDEQCSFPEPDPSWYIPDIDMFGNRLPNDGTAKKRKKLVAIVRH